MQEVPAARSAMPIIALVAVYLLWRLPKRGHFGGRLAPIAAVYVAWSLLSLMWSDDPSITAKRLVVFSINCLFVYTLARVFSAKEIALWGFVQTAAVGALSLYADVLHEHIFAPSDPDYRFGGVMTSNYQAMNLVVCIICGLTLLQARPRWFRWLAPCTGICLVLVYLTRTRLSAILGLMMMSIMIVRFVRKQLQAHTRAIGIAVLMAIVVPGLIFVMGSSGESAAQSAFMMGRNDTENTSNLSNRAPLWAELLESVGKRPWFGYGYQGFWTPARLEKVSADQGWVVPHAHNTYLDQMLSLGAIGILLYGSMVLGGTAMAWRRFLRSPSESSLFLAILLTWLALTGIAESVPLDPYLPTIIAYTCLMKMCMVEGSEDESDAQLGSEIITGLPISASIASTNPQEELSRKNGMARRRPRVSWRVE